MKRRVSERRIVDVLVSHLREHYRISREVPHYEKRIDVAALCQKTDELWAIEAKISDWSKAVSQAIVNLAVADRSFIAIYSENAHRVALSALQANGIGLISVGSRWGDVRIVIDAQKSPFTNQLARQRIWARIHGG